MSGGAFVSWAAYLGLITIKDPWLAIYGYRLTTIVLTIAAVGEFVADKLPWIPSRKTLFPFAGRIIAGALSGAAIGVSADGPLFGAIAGIAGALIGTIGGHRLRADLAGRLGRDLPSALIEDAIVILLCMTAIFLAK